MNTHQLETYVALAELGSINKAAEFLGATPPAVKRQLDALESFVGVPLVSRSHSGASLTAAGQAFLPHARKVLETLEAGVYAANQMQASQQRRMRLLYQDRPVNETAGIYREALRAFQKAHPETAISLVEAQHFSQVGQDDVFVGFFDGTPGSAREFHLAFIPLYVAVPPMHPLSSRTSLGIEDLADYPLLSMPREALAEIEPPILPTLSARKLSIEHMDAHRYTLRVSARCLIDTNALALVIGVDDSLASTLQLIPLAGYRYNYRVYTRIDANPAAVEYAEFISSFYQQHCPEA